jgi:hypothetical protein
MHGECTGYVCAKCEVVGMGSFHGDGWKLVPWEVKMWASPSDGRTPNGCGVSCMADGVRGAAFTAVSRTRAMYCLCQTIYSVYIYIYMYALAC